MVVEIKKLFKPSMVDDQINIRKGYTIALGQLSSALLRVTGVELIDVLLANCVPSGKENDDAETRREAIKSLVNVVKTLGIANVASVQLLQIVECFFKALEDYAVDKRGDVGSWVREEAMVSLTFFVQ
jgi:tubulin-specific chaperone D